MASYDEDREERAFGPRRSSAAVNDVKEIARQRDRGFESDDKEDFDERPAVEGQIEALMRVQRSTNELLKHLEDRLRPFLMPVPDGDGMKGDGTGTKEHSELWHAIDAAVTRQLSINEDIATLTRRVER